MIVDRKKTLNSRHAYVYEKPEKDHAITIVKMIDENGSIQQETQEVIVDPAEELKKIPAYTTKIEYQEIYGTLDTNNEVRYKMMNPSYKMSNEEILRLRNQIISENYQFAEEKPQEVNQEVNTEVKPQN